MELQKIFHDQKGVFYIAEALDAIKNSIPVPIHVEKDFHNKDLYILWTKLLGISTGSLQVAIQFEDEGVALGSAGSVNEFDVVGAGGVLTRVGNKVTLTIPGAGGGSDVLANCLFVDAVYGNDGTALPGNLSKKYQRIQNAKAAAVAGDVIYVYPGTYDIESTDLFADGIKYYFSPGVTVSRSDGGVLFDASFIGDCKVFGYADFLNDGIVISMGGGTGYIQCRSIFSNGSFAISGDSGVLTVDCETDIANNSNPCVQLRDGTYKINAKRIFSNFDVSLFCTGAVDPASSVLIRVDTIENFSGSFDAIRIEDRGLGFYQGNLQIYADQLIGSPNWNIDVGREVVRIGNQGVGGNIPEIYIKCRRIFYPCTFALTPSDVVPRGVIGVTSGDFLKIVFDCDIVSQEQVGIGWRNNTDNTKFYFNGDILCVAQPNFWSGTFGNAGYIKLNGTFLTQNAANNMRMNVAETLELDGKIENEDPGGIGVGVNKLVIGSTLLFNTMKVITTGGATLSAPGVDVYRVMSVLGKNNAAVNLTNLIIGSIDYTDVNIQ